jgi:hypothetical protein
VNTFPHRSGSTLHDGADYTRCDVCYDPWMRKTYQCACRREAQRRAERRASDTAVGTRPQRGIADSSTAGGSPLASAALEAAAERRPVAERADVVDVARVFTAYYSAADQYDRLLEC